LKKRLLAVGDSTELEIIYSCGRHAGKFAKAPRLYTSDPSVKESRLKISGVSMDPNDTTGNHLIRIDPFGLTVIIGEEKKEYKIQVENLSGQKIGMNLVSTHPDFLDVKIPNDIKPGKSQDIKIKFKNVEERSTIGFKKSITIELTDAAKTRYTIPISYEKEQPQVASRPTPTSSQSTQTTPTGLRTKNGNNIDLINAGTRRDN
jgi:hypothetical protein